MAKWGEGDPRWIVEERPDATNVNNWHWTEKNATAWSKDKIQQIFSKFLIEEDGIACQIDSIDKCTGEATANNRKGKLIFFYEWEIELKWSGKLKNCKNPHKGKITIPNLSEENDIDEIEVTITIDESNDESEMLKQFMYNIGRDKIKKQLAIYIKELKEEYSKNLILPKKGEVIQNDRANNQDNAAAKAVKAALNSYANDTNPNNNTLGCKLDVRELTMTLKFQCSPNDIYNALTKVDMLTAFTHGPVKAEAVRGGEFTLYGGNVHGKYEELVPEKKITQTWRLKSWPSGHFSNVTMTIEESSGKTKVTLYQTGIPASDFDAMKTNWNRYYWNSIKQTFGFGAALI